MPLFKVSNKTSQYLYGLGEDISGHSSPSQLSPISVNDWGASVVEVESNSNWWDMLNYATSRLIQGVKCRPYNTRHQRMHVPAWGLIRGNGNTEIVTRGAKLGLCGLFVKTTLTSVNTMFEIDWVSIIPHNGTFSDIGQKPPFSFILWPLEGQNLANVAEKRINSEHSHKKCTQQVWIGYCGYFSR